MQLHLPVSWFGHRAEVRDMKAVSYRLRMLEFYGREHTLPGSSVDAAPETVFDDSEVRHEEELELQ